MIRISIIIPTFNRKHLLPKTLSSIFNQTIPPHEVIVIDDGSTDGTMEYLRTNFGEELILLKNEGRGPGAARNLGLKVATGEYIKFFDSDDLMAINLLESQLRKIANSNKGCIYSPYFRAVEVAENQWQLFDDAILQFYSVPQTHPLQYWMIRGLFLTIPSFLFRREFLDKVGQWRTDLTTYEDWDFLWRIATCEPYPLHTNESAFLYRVHGVQTTGFNLDDSLRDRDKIDCFINLLKEIQHNHSFSLIDRLIFETSIARVLKKNRKKDWASSMNFNFDNLKYRITGLSLVIINKLGRLQTRTNWQPMHGPLISRDKVCEYIRMISPSSSIVW